MNIDKHYTQTKSVARLKFKRRQPPIASLPSPSCSLPSLPFLSPPFTSYGVWRSAVSSPSGVWGEALAAEQFGAYLSQKEWPC